MTDRDRLDIPEPKHSPRKSEKTRARILDVAAEHFAEQGLEGARVDAVAEAAGVNKASLYYYFGNKEGLYLNAIEHSVRNAYEDVRQTIAEVAGRGSDLMSGFNDFPAIMAELGERHRATVRIVLRECANGGRYLREARERNPEWLGANVGNLAQLFAMGTALGVLRPHDPRMTVVVATAVVLVYFGAWPIVEVFLPGEGDQRWEHTEFLEFFRDLVMRGLAPDLSSKEGET